MADPFLYNTGERARYGCLGHEVQIEYLKAYVCGPTFLTDKAVIVVHDVFGWRFPDIRFIVDFIARHGYIAICPDFFKGSEPWKSTDHWGDFADWMKDHDPMKVDKEADVVLKYLKEQCGAKKIGIVGFSWGGMAVHHLMLKNPQLIAGVSHYGIIRDSEERYNLLNPTFFIFGEKDHTISLDQVTLLEEKLQQYCKVQYKIKVYPGQVHGFAQLKPEDMKPDDKPYIEEARKDMIDWIKMFV
ncbi:PREDICTED: carboxymethylenebutenolidase homolog [Acanthisitta chloris]|nr:PREDICTED: carboxymethylenebutenolidase homolog [Acanthisitta chloris]